MFLSSAVHLSRPIGRLCSSTSPQDKKKAKKACMHKATDNFFARRLSRQESNQKQKKTQQAASATEAVASTPSHTFLTLSLDDRLACLIL